MGKSHQSSLLRSKLPTILGFILICSLPEIMIWSAQPDGMIFTGTLVNVDDLNVYLSAIRQGAEGKWLFTPQFSPEKTPAHLALIPYILLGKAQQVFNGPTIVYFQILRFIAFIFVCWTLLKLVQSIFPDSYNLQSKAFNYLLFSSGLGWLVLFISGTTSQLTPDLTTPEWNLVTSFLSAPHFMLGIGFQVLLIFVIQDLTKSQKISHVIRFFIFGAGLGLVYPFLLPVNGLIITFWLVTNGIQNRKLPWKLLVSSGIGSIPMVLLLAYYGLFPPQNPQIPPPSLIGIIFGFGLLLIFTLISIPNWINSNHSIIYPIWIIAVVIALYLPFDFSGRFILGLFIPLSIITAYGLDKIYSTKFQQVNSEKNFEGLNLSRIFFLLMIPSNILVLIFSFNAAKTSQDYPYYYLESEKQALIWLAENSTGDDLLLADYPISSLTPRFASTRTFLGHLYLTINLEDKREQLLQFWDADTTNKQREDFLLEWGITHIYQGRFENSLTNEIVTPPGTIIYEQDEITIYTVQP